MLEDQADRHKLRWIALIGVILAVVIGFAFAKWASKNKPLRSHISSSPALSMLKLRLPSLLGGTGDERRNR